MDSYVMWKGAASLIREEEAWQWSFSMGGSLWSLQVDEAGPLLYSSKVREEIVRYLGRTWVGVN